MAETEVIKNQHQSPPIAAGSVQATTPEDAGLTSEERIEEEKFAILSNKVRCSKKSPNSSCPATHIMQPSPPLWHW